ncbi:predicted protein [Nematostella vectensis]|uniref:Ubiquitin-like domain-containing protein n=1 Tax=Nematostella vectensis TaxID=45351 RepID=A7RNI9_NEMVE|nr:predicted protein [Nematostella vectensis]|eukprot:XP_001638929.1 predicted protein [Nematostella vectensis]
MKVIVKILNGKEAELEVSETEPILAVKTLVAQELDVQVERQRLVYKGKTLADDCSLDEYLIGDGSKLYLSIKKLSSQPGSSQKNYAGSNFWNQLHKLLKSHLNEKDADKVLQRCKQDFKSWSRRLSLDDIERMSQLHLEETMASR